MKRESGGERDIRLIQADLLYVAKLTDIPEK